MGRFLKWFLVGVTGLTLLGMQRQWIPVIFLLLALVVILPPLHHLLEAKVPILKRRGLKFLAWFGLYCLAGGTFSAIDPHIKHLQAQKNFGELIQIVQKQEALADQAATALGELGDRRAVKPLIAVITTNTDDNSSLQDNAVEALGKLRDPEAVKPLAKLLSGGSATAEPEAKAALKAIAAQNPEVLRPLIADLKSAIATEAETAKAALIAIGAPAVDDLLILLKAAPRPEKPIVMETLGQISDAKAVTSLKGYLTDWELKAEAGKALETLNWQPETDQDRVSYWVALERGTQLNQNWEITKRVLMERVKSDKRTLIEYGLYAFITLGNRDVLPELVESLHNQESKEMALAYLNCGEDTLEKAATQWANDRGYEVIKVKDTSGRKVAWGTLKN